MTVEYISCTSNEKFGRRCSPHYLVGSPVDFEKQFYEEAAVELAIIDGEVEQRFVFPSGIASREIWHQDGQTTRTLNLDALAPRSNDEDIAFGWIGSGYREGWFEPGECYGRSAVSRSPGFSVPAIGADPSFFTGYMLAVETSCYDGEHPNFFFWFPFNGDSNPTWTHHAIGWSAELIKLDHLPSRASNKIIRAIEWVERERPYLF